MGSLAGLVNYSDDEDSSSSGDEQTQVAKILTKKAEKKVAQKSTVVIKKAHIGEVNIKAEATPPLPPAAATAATTTPLATVISNTIKAPLANKLPGGEEEAKNEHHRRLMAALAPKPIEGLDNWGIPDEPNTPCDPERAERVAHFLSLRASGHRLNDHLQHNKSFRNPRIYTRLVEFTEVDEFGSNFDKKDFDPAGFPKELYIDGILETQKKLAEEKAAAQQNRTSVNFVSTQAPQQKTELSQQQSSAMAQAMATATKVASRIAKPPIQHHDVVPEKRRNKWDDDKEHKRR